MSSMEKNHYEVLEVSRDAELIDIKKAYRRLALKHHPDRNNGSDASTEKFKEISLAYQILSDATSRRDYDLCLKNPSTSVSTTYKTSPRRRYPRRGRDAFQQFDDLFRNDPFFSEGFQNMDDAFAKRFHNSQDLKRKRDNNVSDADDVDDTGFRGVGSIFSCGGVLPTAQKKNESWTQWLMNKLGIKLSVTSYSHNSDGSMNASVYSSDPIGTYTNKTSRTYVENGRRVTIMSMEKDGNTIEDKLIEGKLVERKVNGRMEDVSSLEN